MIALDQNHEQESRSNQRRRGAVGLAENLVALRCWMVAGPEVARVVKEKTYTEISIKNKNIHHEQVPCVQTTFAKDVQSLTREIENLGNPFTEDLPDHP